MSRRTLLPFVVASLLALIPIRAHAQFSAQLVAGDLQSPLAFVQVPGDPSAQVIVELGGRVRLLRNGVLQSRDFLDLSEVVLAGGEQGLLGLAFAPDYALSGRLFVDFVDQAGNTVVARFTRSADDAWIADPASRFDLIWPTGLPFIVQIYGNHNGGNLAFGPDGYLYVGTGDGGGADDPQHQAQDPTSLLGKMLRLDVMVSDADPEGYDVPPTNPFVGQEGIIDLIWAIGYRNPWRWSFDDPQLGGTGALIVGDVGQDGYEEIDYEPAGAGGRNYGWRNREGAHDYLGDLPPFSEPLTDPLFEVEHPGAESIIGGFVYRGRALGSSFYGRYFFTDFVYGWLWSFGLDVNPDTGEATAFGLETHDDLDHVLVGPASFGVDADGELYIVEFLRGAVHKLVLRGDTPPPGPNPGEPPPGSSCTTPDPFAALGGGVCRDGGWLPPGTPTDPPSESTFRATAAVYDAASGEYSIERSTDAGGFDARTGAWPAGWTARSARFSTSGFGDFLLRNPATGEWAQVIGDGHGGFTTLGSGLWSPAWQTTFGDLNGDGLTDVFLWDPTAGEWFECLALEQGGFAYAHGFWSPGWEVYPARLNADSRQDFFLFNRASGQWAWAISETGGAFSYPQSGFWSPDWQFSFGDFDGNGQDDVFLMRPETGQWFIAATGPQGFTYSSGFFTPGYAMYPMDIDADGRTDLFVYNTDTGQWFEMLSTGAGGFANAGSGTWSTGWTIHPVDLNSDARLDLLLYCPTSGVWFQARNLVTGDFTYSSGAWTAALEVVITKP